MASIIQLRTDNEAQWKVYNPILAKGELAISADTVPAKFKVGDGIKTWTALDYFAGLAGIQGEKGIQGIQGLKGDTGNQGVAGDPATLINDATTAVNGLWSSKKISEQIATIWALKWSEKFILCNPADGYSSPSLPLSRNGTLAKIDFYVTGAPASATTITVKQGATTLSPTVVLSAIGKTTLTFGTAVVGTEDDVFSYTITGAGLAASVVTCNQKWVNR
jgi:hypothetical protein